MSIDRINKELGVFETSVKKLSTGISKASTLWGDAKYSELSASVGTVALQSRDVMEKGDKCCTALTRFGKIAEEKY